MDDLIKALTIFSKYTDTKYPTHCEHDVMMVMVDPNIVSPEDIIELEQLGFDVTEDNCFSSFHFGSA